jgi:bifunctional non-homologous end joining protein LigD
MDRLGEYNEKRDFQNTPEPAGQPRGYEEKNRFVIQRHMARREHYDFRLQLEDVLISWAIPKKPVNDPQIKRLAIKVEDHPIDYIHFEGNIPKGNYGAGSVMVWDIGYYYLDEARNFPSPAEIQKRIARGSLKLYLQGVKLRGYFNLVKSNDPGKDEWLFMKAGGNQDEDDYEQRSALTGRSMDEIAASGIVWHPERSEDEKKGVTGKAQDTKKLPDGKIQQGGQATAGTANDRETGRDINSGAQSEKQEFPGFIKPMTATLSDKAFSGDGWIFEMKFDGYRIIAVKNDDKALLFSRNGNDLTHRFPVVADELSAVKASFVIDGEVCYMEGPEKANFQKLKHPVKVKEQDRVHYHVFDMLWLNGHDLKELPLRDRKKLLAVLLKNPLRQVHYLDHIENNGEAFYAEVEKKQLEGIIAKRAAGKYYPGYRSEEWLKIKTGHRQEMIICGYMPSGKESRAFRSLLCAVNQGRGLVYTGRVGTGFSESLQKEIFGKLKKIKSEEIPVINPPVEKDIQWVKPLYVCEVKFAGWTQDRIMRHASFAGLRSDKEPGEIVVEKAVRPLESGTKVKFSNLSKLFWPDEAISKGDVIEFYRDISGYILPYLKDRPQSLYRTPNGITEKGFFQKNAKEIAPDWAETVKIKSSKGGHTEYLLCQDTDTLLFMANLGCIEINPWSSSVSDLDKPDFMVFDLDPVEVEFGKVLQIALAFKNLFDQLSLPAWCKTSGSRGLHIYVPVQQKYTYPQVQNFVKTIEKHIHSKFPDITSLERSPSKRKGKVYLDYLQNAKGKTMSSVYSIRPRPGATVSAPVRWEELEEGITPGQFNLRNMRKRLDKEGDLWKGFLDTRVDMGTVLQTLT